MEALYPDLVDFREQLANRLMMLALHCQDAVTRQKLIATAAECRGRIEPMTERNSTPQDRTMTIIGWRH